MLSRTRDTPVPYTGHRLSRLDYIPAAPWKKLIFLTPENRAKSGQRLSYMGQGRNERTGWFARCSAAAARMTQRDGAEVKRTRCKTAAPHADIKLRSKDMRSAHIKTTVVGAVSSPRRAIGQNQGCNVGNVKWHYAIKELQHEKNIALPSRLLRIHKSKLAPLV